MQNSRLLIVFLAFLSVSVCSFNIYLIEQERKELKNDLIELSKIKYGLFNVDEWRDIVSDILSKKVEELDFNPEQEADAREKISSFLHDAIEDMETRFYDEQSQSVEGMVKIGVASVTDMFGEIKKNIPQYTDDILAFIRVPENREGIKKYISGKLSEYTANTFSAFDYTAHDQILTRHNIADHDEAVSILTAEVDTLDIKLKKYLYAGLFVAFLCALGLMFTPTLSKIEYVMYVFISLGLLVAGVTLPMIEIDARIAEISFSLLGEPVSFSDQVLYYRSKSILEVVTMMLTQGKPDVLFVGFLVLLFSVIFPVSKLLTSLIYLYTPSLNKNRFFRFMVFRTGKWSMADVMVIAIFMAFIGFSGILTDQLGQLEGFSAGLDVLTTNHSSLQDGFFIFTSFVILSLLVAHRMQFKETPVLQSAAVAPVAHKEEGLENQEKSDQEEEKESKSTDGDAGKEVASSDTPSEKNTPSGEEE